MNTSLNQTHIFSSIPHTLRINPRDHLLCTLILTLRQFLRTAPVRSRPRNHILNKIWIFCQNRSIHRITDRDRIAQLARQMTLHLQGANRVKHLTLHYLRRQTNRILHRSQTRRYIKHALTHRTSRDDSDRLTLNLTRLRIFTTTCLHKESSCNHSFTTRIQLHVDRLRKPTSPAHTHDSVILCIRYRIQYRRLATSGTYFLTAHIFIAELQLRRTQQFSQIIDRTTSRIQTTYDISTKYFIQSIKRSILRIRYNILVQRIVRFT